MYTGRARWRIRVRGLVQGVGFRPFVWKLARSCNCSGWVLNDTEGVLIEVQGAPDCIAEFRLRLQRETPPLAAIFSCDHDAVETLEGEAGFEILESRETGLPRASVSPDLAPCVDCLQELRDPLDRRFGYPFLNCTNCGPRFTIQMAVPYDRVNTTMARFEMCSLCSGEYQSPSNRRFHAQPNACPECGPCIWFTSFESERCGAGFAIPATEVIAKVRQSIALGKIIAIKGIGGFHLACDATNDSAVQQLRLRKGRPMKPFAVMVADSNTAARLVHLDEPGEVLLEDPKRPIVLLRKKAGKISDKVAPENPYLGIMLPYSPLHYLLLENDDVWVMTSGNLADESIVYENNEAMERLSVISDGFLLHDRPIHTVCDDSVVRPVGMRSGKHQPIPIRRSRGYAPMPVPLADVGDCVLALGGEMKSALCLTIGSQAIVGPHVGDMGHRDTVDALQRSRDHLLRLYAAVPTMIACDLHPGYISTQCAQRWANAFSIPLVSVQHHHAHAASLLAEHRLPPDQSIIACVFDGTGFGSDGTIWGGEVLVANASKFERVGHLSYMPLPGGDSCILKPAKTALAYMYSAGIEWTNLLPCVRFYSASVQHPWRLQIEKKINTLATSSMGRLFDAVAAIIGLSCEIDYEGQAALELEALAESEFESGENVNPYSIQWIEGTTAVLCLEQLLREICIDVLENNRKANIAARFHLTISKAFAARCERIRRERMMRQAPLKLNTVGLTGGVFQNAVLLKLMQAALSELGFDVLTHQKVPPNDGGLSLGQAWVAQRLAATDRP